MRISRAGLAALPLLALPLAACGASVSVGSTPKVGSDELAKQVLADVRGHSTGDTSTITVTCAGDVSAKIGATQDCDISDGSGGTTGVHLTVDHVEGTDAHFSEQLFLHGTDVADAASGAFKLPDGSMTCPDLDGTVGTKVTCTVTRTSQSVVASVTKVDGLTIDMHFQAGSAG